MKDYHTVIENRYNTESGSSGSIYAPDHPIGKYSRSKLFPCILSLLRKNLSSKNYADIRLLDVGCGSGGMISFFIENGFSPENVTGVDLCKKRINEAKLSVPDANLLLENGLSFRLHATFDLITSFDMFSHISTEKEIVDGLKNVHAHLNDAGIFLWFDIFSEDHFSSPADIDSWGFSTEQMSDLAARAGFFPVDKKTLFKNLFGKYNSVYQARRFPSWMLSVMENILPGTPGNVAMVFRKA